MAFSPPPRRACSRFSMSCFIFSVCFDIVLFFFRCFEGVTELRYDAITAMQSLRVLAQLGEHAGGGLGM
jgi:hypothetical protein